MKEEEYIICDKLLRLIWKADTIYNSFIFFDILKSEKDKSKQVKETLTELCASIHGYVRENEWTP